MRTVGRVFQWAVFLVTCACLAYALKMNAEPQQLAIQFSAVLLAVTGLVTGAGDE